MPIIQQSIGGVSPQVDQPESSGVGFADAFRLSLEENSLALLADAVDNVSNIDSTIDPTFDPLAKENIAGYEDSALELASAQNANEFKRRTAKIDRKRERDRILAESGATGALAQLAAGAIDPINYVPVGAAGLAYRLSRTARVLRSAASAAGAGAVSGAAYESLAQNAQYGRSNDESLYTIGGGLILGGALGATYGAIVGRELGRPLSAISDGIASEYRASTSLSAAETPRTTMEQETIVPVGGLEKLKISPVQTLMNSPSLEARRAVQELADTVLLTKKNLEGIATADPVESYIRRRTAAVDFADVHAANKWLEYRGATPSFGKATTIGITDAFTGGNGRLTQRQFLEEVGRAMIRGDEHPIPQVAEAARFYRKHVFDPLKQEAIDAGLLPDGVKVGTADSYLMRVYNKEKISSSNEFRDILTAGLRREQANSDSLAVKAAKDRDEAARKLESKKAEIADLRETYRRNKSEETRKAIRAAERDLEFLNERLSHAKDRQDYAGYIASLNEADLRGVADDIVNGILGFAPGRTAYHGVPVTRGPLKERLLNFVTDAEIEAYLDKDITSIARRYAHTMAADIGLKQRFGRADLRDTIDAVRQEYAKLRENKSEKEIASLRKAEKSDIQALEGMRDRLRGAYGIPSNPRSLFTRAFKSARALNVLRLLGGVTISSIPDVASIVMAHGVQRTLSDGLAPFVKNMKLARLSASEAKLAGTALDMVNNNTALVRAGLDDAWAWQSKFERGLAAASNHFQYITLMAPWNAALKQVTGLISQARSIEAIGNIMKGGVIASKELARLANLGIDKEMALRIGAQLESHAVKDGGMTWANTNAWGDRVAAEAYLSAMQREIDRVIVTPGQELPLFMSRELGGVIMQFKSFSAAATQRVLLARLQQRDAAALNGAILSTALGMMVYAMKTDPDKLADTPMEKWVVEGIDRSGATGWLMDVNNTVEKITGGNVGLSPLLGVEPMNRYVSRGAAGAVFGPTYGLVADTILPLVYAASRGEATQSDLHRARQMLPYQNLFYIRGLLDSLEEGVSGSLGLPQKRGQ